VHGLGAEGPVLAAIESMSGARFVHDQLELAGWDVRIADARRVKGLAPLACKTDRIDAWVLGYAIAAELGEIDRFRTPAKVVGYTGLCPRVRQSGEIDRRGRLSKQSPPYLRWALIEAAHNAIRYDAGYR
jgi:transposase